MEEIKGIVLSSIDYKEKSKIVYLYTPYGLLSVKANRAKDQKSGLLSFTTTLNEVSFIKTDSKFPTVIEYHLVNSFYSLADSIKNIKIIGILINVIRNIPNETDHEKTYNFIIKTLNDIKSMKYDNDKVLSVFLIKMLYAYGVTPSMRKCELCDNEPTFLDIKEGVSYCMNHKGSNYLYNIFKEYYYSKDEIDKLSDVEFFDLLNWIFEYYRLHTELNLG